MKHFLLLSVITLFFVASGCEVEDSEQDFPFQLKLVVRGVLESNKPIQDIYVGRTLPISYSFTKSFADLPDASVGILYRDSLYVLRHKKDGLYFTNGLIPVQGETYKLLVQWKSYFATAETTVPLIGTVEAVELKSHQGSQVPQRYIECSIRPYMNEAYALTWVSLTVSNTVTTEANEFNGVMKKGLQAYDGFMKVTTDTITPGILTETLGYRIHAFDERFYDYFITQNTNKVSDAVFGQPNSNVKWNVQGDGIGIFFAKTDTVRRL